VNISGGVRKPKKPLSNATINCVYGPISTRFKGTPHFFRSGQCLYADSRTGIVQETTLVNFMWKMDGVILMTSAKKGGHFKYRLVPIHPQFVQVLEGWYRKDNNKDCPIIHFRKKPVKSLKRAIKRAKQKSGITRRLPMYNFRHVFATLTLRHHADLKSTSELLGHSRTDTTTRIYQHVDFTMHQKAVGVLPGLDFGHT
jgi:integrase